MIRRSIGNPFLTKNERLSMFSSPPKNPRRLLITHLMFVGNESRWSGPSISRDLQSILPFHPTVLQLPMEAGVNRRRRSAHFPPVVRAQMFNRAHLLFSLPNLKKCGKEPDQRKIRSNFFCFISSTIMFNNEERERAFFFRQNK